MNITFPALVSAAIGFLLAGCGGSGGSTFAIEDFEQDFAAAAGASVTDYQLTVADPNSLSGSASFSGVVILPTVAEADEAVLGQFSLDADFDSGAVIGRANQFGLYDFAFASADTFGDAFDKREDLSGSLTVRNGNTREDVFGPVQAQLVSGDLVGSLTGTDGVYEVDVNILGGVGNATAGDALVVTGNLEGTIDGPSGLLVYGADSGVVGAVLLATE